MIANRLNAGTATTDPALGANTEYNAQLGVASYRAIFELPCPVWWLPCFETLAGHMRVEKHGSFWSFRQGDVLARVGTPLRQYFLYALGRQADHKWLSRLDDPEDPALLEAVSAQARNMWCTAGYLHLAGLTVLRDGRIAPAPTAGDDAVFGFERVAVTPGEQGVARWEPSTGATPERHLFTVRDLEAYPRALGEALATLLAAL